MRGDVVSIIEAAYRMGTSEKDWLVGVLEAARPALDKGEGVVSFTFDASDPARMRVREVASHSCVAPMTADVVAQLVETADPDYVRATWRSRLCDLGSRTPGVRKQPGWAMLSSMGVVDNLSVNSVDPSGFGCLLSANSSRRLSLHPRTKQSWEHVAAHLANGLRLRRRLASLPDLPSDVSAGADAVLGPGGKVQHAEGEAALTGARQALQEAAVAIDRARGRLRRSDPEDAVAGWKGLIDARWSLVDHFDSDGKRYLVARRNSPQVMGLAGLTERERQVAGYVGLGLSNKLIAYEIGIAASTVRVLVSRAVAKLGVASREALVRLVARAIERSSD